MTRLETLQGDITKVEVDAVVNAANRELIPGGGVDGAIHAAGGPQIAAEARVIAERDGILETGQAVATTAGNLPAKHVIHTPGPVWGRVSGDEAQSLLADCYRNSLDLAAELGSRTVAFPNISTGIYGFPKDLAASTAVETVENWVACHPDTIDRVVFVCFGEDNLELYRNLLD